MIPNGSKSQGKDCVILIDKVPGVTSFSSLGAIKKRINKKAGHAGTLDKFASGLLIVMCGSKTKLCEQFMGFDKTYIATFCLGKETDTLDPEGKIIYTSEYVPTINEIQIELEKNFTGNIFQSPPRFSAIHINGKRAYQLALSDKEFEIQKRPVTIHSADLIEYNYPYLKVCFNVSKGTYIRSIARDLGRNLKCYSYLYELRRTRIGNYNVDDAIRSDLILQTDDLSAFMLSD